MARKYLIFTIAMLLFSQMLWAQQSDTITIVPAKRRHAVSINDFMGHQDEYRSFWDRDFSGHWSGVHLGINSFLQKDYSNYLPAQDGFMNLKIWRSFSYQINFWQKSISLQRYHNAIGLVTGLGLCFDDYRFNPEVTLEADKNGVIQPVYPGYEEMRKSKLSTFYGRVPLLLEFQIPVGHFQRRFFISGGVVFGYKLGSHTKIKYHQEGISEKVKFRDELYLSDFRYSYSVRMGYRWFNVFAEYSPVPFFKDGHGPVLYPFTVGITLVSF
jgi:hypothetical protein